MSSVFADPQKNRLYILLDSMADDEVQIMLKAISSEIKKIRGGFTCLVDIRNLALVFGEHETNHVETIQRVLKESGLSNVVRVIGQDSFRRYIHNRMNDISRVAGCIADAAETFQEAERMLDRYRSRPVVVG